MTLKVSAKCTTIKRHLNQQPNPFEVSLDIKLYTAECVRNLAIAGVRIMDPNDLNKGVIFWFI